MKLPIVSPMAYNFLSRHPEVDLKKSKLKPSIFIPTLYFAEGLPYTIVNLMSVVFYKNAGASNTFIGEATSFLYLPWTLKFIWSPFVDVYSTKRKWLLVSQAVLGLIAVLLVGSIFLTDGLFVTVVIFFAMALASATHDIAIDGYYLDVLDKGQQAFYVGVRNAAYKVAWLLGSGGLVFVAGKLAETTSLGVKGGWAVSFGVCAILLLLCAAFHALILPEPASSSGEDSTPAKVRNAIDENPSGANDSASDNAAPDNSTSENSASEKGRRLHPTLTPSTFKQVFTAWLSQPRIAAIIIYILIFRAGDALMLKMAQPFLLDEVQKGGLAISTADVGIIYGTVGVLFLLAGGIIGGVLVSRYGLRKCLLPTALIQNGAIILYWMLAAAKPQGPVLIGGLEITKLAETTFNNPEILRWFDARLFSTISVNSIEQFSYGLGTAAYTVFLLSTVKSEYKAAHYAIATAIMALGVMLPGFISGHLADSLGYEKFFLVSFFASIPGLASIFFLPLEEKKE